MYWAAVLKQILSKRQQLPNTKIILNCIYILKLHSFDVIRICKACNQESLWFSIWSVQLKLTGHIYRKHVDNSCLSHLPKLSSIISLAPFPSLKQQQKSYIVITPHLKLVLSSGQLHLLFCHQGLFPSFEN